MFKSQQAVYRKIIGVFIMFDVTNRESFAETHKLLENFRKYAPKHVAKILVATKIDLADQRKVSNEEANRWRISLEFRTSRPAPKMILTLLRPLIHSPVLPKRRWRSKSLFNAYYRRNRERHQRIQIRTAGDALSCK